MVTHGRCKKLAAVANLRLRRNSVALFISKRLTHTAIIRHTMDMNDEQPTHAPIKKYLVNYSSEGFARGGHLKLYADHLEFAPTGLEKTLTNTDAFAVGYADVASVDVAPRTWNLLDGGLRKRLRITLNNGAVLLFVVNRPNATASEINDIVGAARR